MSKRECPGCGKEADLMTWETNCYRCRQKDYSNGIMAEIISGEKEETYCEDEVYCPHCGEVQTMTDCWDHYEEGEHEYTCQDCDKEFVIDTTVRYLFSTRRD